MHMKKEKVTVLDAQKLKNVNGGVAPGPNGEECTEQGLFNILNIFN